MAGEEGGLATAAESQPSVEQVDVAAAADEELGRGGFVDLSPGAAEIGAAGAAVGGLGLCQGRGGGEEGEGQEEDCGEVGEGTAEAVHGARALGGQRGGRQGGGWSASVVDRPAQALGHVGQRSQLVCRAAVAAFGRADAKTRF